MEQPTNPQSDSILLSAGPTDRQKKGYFYWLVVIGDDDDSDDSDDGILPSAGPTDRWNNQQTHKVTAFCYQQDQQT